jgi:serine protease Do
VGSNSFLNDQGAIATASHVTADNETTVVRLAVQHVFLAQRVVEDNELDIAVIRIPLAGSVPAPSGTSAALRPGDWVLAVGAPFDLRGSVLASVAGSSLRHVGEDIEGMLVQTNRSLNPGNSGRALRNLGGAAVGMNARTVVGAKGTGVSLSFPIDLIFQIRRELEGGIQRPRFCARFDDVSPPVAHVARLAARRGAPLCEVNRAGPADRAGLRVGDIVVRMDGAGIIDSAHSSRRLFAWRHPKAATFTIVRDRQVRTVLLQ